MKFGRKGAQAGSWIIAVGILVFFIFGIVAVLLRGAPADMGSPSYVADYYRNIFYERDKFRDPLVLVFMIFVPFLSTFALAWGLLSQLPPFGKTQQGRNAAAVIAFGFGLYGLPAVSTVLSAFLPWGLTIAGVMLISGIIALAINYGVVPWITSAGEIKEAGEKAKAAGKRRPWWSREEEEGEEKDTRKLERAVKDFIDDDLEPFLVRFKNVIDEKDEKSFKRYKDAGHSYGESCDKYIDKIKESEMPDYRKGDYIDRLERLMKLLRSYLGEVEELEKKIKPEEPGIICPKCGTENVKSAHFCKKCGEDFKKKVKLDKDIEKLNKLIEKKLNEEKMKEEDERLREVWYRTLNAMEASTKELLEIKSTVMDNLSVMSSNLKSRCNNLYRKLEDLNKLSNEMKNIFRKEKTFDQALDIFWSRGYFRDIKNAGSEVMDAAEEIHKTYPSEAKEEITIKRTGKTLKKTYAEAFPAVYNEILPEFLSKLGKNMEALGVQISNLEKLTQRTVKKEQEGRKKL